MNDELLNMLANLAVPESYGDLDRYQDFRNLFLEDDRGRRVLKQILAWGHLLNVPKVGRPIDVHNFMISEGERNLSLKILAALMVEPKTPPDKQETRPKE